jgi:hypothetical protein
MTLEVLITQRVIPLTAKVVVIVIFSHNLFTKTPLRLELSRWNVILRYRTGTFIVVVIQQTSDFFINLYPYFLFPWFISVICVWIVGVLLLFASLYRYERYAPKSNDRLMTVLRGSREYAILQALRAIAIVLALINIYIFVHRQIYRYLGIDYNAETYYNLLKFAEGVLGLGTMLYFAVVDMASSVLMASDNISNTRLGERSLVVYP